jgi:transcriptional regulator with XRE-family HTH domain
LADLNLQIADMLINVRLKAKLTQTQVAKKLGCSRSYISKLESGRISPMLSTIDNYIVACGFRFSIHAD